MNAPGGFNPPGAFSIFPRKKVTFFRKITFLLYFISTIFLTAVKSPAWMRQKYTPLSNPEAFHSSR
jgi:hypothetical protein